MSSTATESSEDGEPDTWTESGHELEMIRGNAYNRTAEPVVWVDARCIGCSEVSVNTIPANPKDWTPAMTFADDCHLCSMLTPHNIVSLLTGLNRKRDRGRVQRGEDHD